MKKQLLILLSLFLILSSGCATMFAPDSKKVKDKGNIEIGAYPEGCDVLLNGKHIGKTPMKLSLNEKAVKEGQTIPKTLFISKNGFQSKSIVIEPDETKKRYNRGAAFWTGLIEGGIGITLLNFVKIDSASSPIERSSPLLGGYLLAAGVIDMARALLYPDPNRITTIRTFSKNVFVTLESNEAYQQRMEKEKLAQKELEARMEKERLERELILKEQQARIEKEIAIAQQQQKVEEKVASKTMEEWSVNALTKAAVSPQTTNITSVDVYKRALALANSGQKNQAISVLEEALLQFSNDAHLYSLLGLCYMSLNEFNRAYQNFNKVQILQPSLLHSIYNKPIILGPIYASDGQTFNNVCIISPSYGIIANNNQIRVDNCEIFSEVGIQFNGMGIQVTNSLFKTRLCVEYTQGNVQMGNVFIGNSYYGQWSNVE